MKKLLFIFLALLCEKFSQAQTILDSAALRQAINTEIVSNGTGVITAQKLNRILNGQLNVSSSNDVYVRGDSIFKRRNGQESFLITVSGAESIAGGAITSVPAIGQNPGTNISVENFIALFYQTQPPTATLTGGTVLENTSGSAVIRTLNWTAGRQSATATLATVVVASQSQTFSQPGNNNSVSGTQDVNVPANTSTTYSNVVTTTDGKTATVITTFDFRSKIYIGYISGNSPTDAEIRVATGGTTGGTFATVRQTSGNLSTPSGSSYIVFAIPASFGTPVIKINGLVVEYTVTTRTFTNAQLYTSSYNICISPFPTSSSISYEVQ